MSTNTKVTTNTRVIPIRIKLSNGNTIKIEMDDEHNAIVVSSDVQLHVYYNEKDNKVGISTLRF